MTKDDALRRNLEYKYSVEYIRQIQRCVTIDDDGLFGPQTVAAIIAWQYEHGLHPDGIAGPKTVAAMGIVKPAGTYEERRVRVREYGTLERASELLVEVPGTRSRPRLLHREAAEALASMRKAALAEVGVDILVQSGWRPHRWRSWSHYVRHLTRRYGSFAKGRRYLAFNSPHETGRAIDIGTGGLWPSSRTIQRQRQTELWRWLHDNAWRFGWHPYKAEPWHWEFPKSGH